MVSGDLLLTASRDDRRGFAAHRITELDITKPGT
jgi:hypothetical protein